MATALRRNSRRVLPTPELPSPRASGPSLHFPTPKSSTAKKATTISLAFPTLPEAQPKRSGKQGWVRSQGRLQAAWRGVHDTGPKASNDPSSGAPGKGGEPWPYSPIPGQKFTQSSIPQKGTQRWPVKGKRMGLNGGVAFAPPPCRREVVPQDHAAEASTDVPIGALLFSRRPGQLPSLARYTLKHATTHQLQISWL